MAFHGQLPSLAQMCHPVGVPQGFAHHHPSSGMHPNSYPFWNPPPPVQRPEPGLQNRIVFLETQLTHLQREKDSTHAVIRYLLAELGASKRTNKSCADCGVLKFRLALQRKANHRLKGKYQEAAASLLVKRTQIKRLWETGISTRHSHNSSSSGGDTLGCRESPDTDLLGGAIPFSIIERFPAASSFNTDPPSADSPPGLGNSEDDLSSGSEAESVNYAPSSNPSRLPVISSQQEDRKLLVTGDVLPGVGDSCDFALDSFSSKDELPYIRYFSGAIVSSTSALSEDVDRNKEHMGDLATSASLTWAVSGPVSVAAGPHVSKGSKDDEHSLESAERTSSLTTTGSSLESRDQTLSGDIRRASTHCVHDWKNRLFATEAERESAIAMNRRLAGREDVIFPDIFRYGIRYNPEPTVQNVYRTILIEGLLCTVTLENVLKKVRGGSVLSTKLCDTHSITGSCSALITFLSESAACQYGDFAASHAIYVSGIAVKVSRLNTPTWPMTIPLRKAIFDHHHTRCLEVTNLPRHIDLSALQLDLRVCSSMDCDMIEYLEVRHDGILELRFSSVNAAGQAFGLLTCRAKYRPCSVRFTPDPCALPVDTLLEQGESDLSDDYVTLDDDVPVEQFANDEGVGEGEEYAEEDEPDSLERFSSSEFETGGSAPTPSQVEYFDTLGTSLLD